MSEIKENKALDIDTASDERSTMIKIGGEDFKLILTTKGQRKLQSMEDLKI